VATVDALHTATLQVLTQHGLVRCTTTRVAERAGMSVGSVYQYYPNRDALLAAVLEKHLLEVVRAVEQACRACEGRPVREMASTLVMAFLAVKLRDTAVSKALYAIAGERGGAELVIRINARMIAAVSTLLVTAPDAHFPDPALSAAMSLCALAGPVRALLEGYASPVFEASIEREATRLLQGYLEKHMHP
jgi:AcrR family transcriptional regulator